MRLALLLLCGSLMALVGCAAGGAGDERASMSRVVRCSERDRVMQAAMVILKREFGRVSETSDGRRIISEPLEFRTASDSGTVRDYVGGKSTMRRIASFTCTPRGETVLAQLRVDVEREDSDRVESSQQSQQQPSRFSDTPSQTPVERDAGVSRKQNQAWIFVKRDLQLERVLLEELQSVFEPPPDESLPQKSSAKPAE